VRYSHTARSVNFGSVNIDIEKPGKLLPDVQIALFHPALWMRARVGNLDRLKAVDWDAPDEIRIGPNRRSNGEGPGTKLRRRRQLPTALGAHLGQQGGAFLAELRARLILVLTLLAFH
jgi:hypothetical protein